VTGEMSLEIPNYLWLLSLLPFFVAASVGSYRGSRRWLEAFSRRRRRATPSVLSILFLCSAFGAIVLSQAGPRVQYEKSVFNRSGIDICIGVDVSKSMLAEDVGLPPDGQELFRVSNRLNRTRSLCLDLLSRVQGERIGLFIFASQGVELIPFTRDYGYCRYMLRHVNDTEITASGSDLGEAILTGISMLEDTKGASLKRMVLVSDGEDIRLDQSSMYESAGLAAAKGIRIYTVGIGTGRSVLIPIRSADSAAVTGYYLDEDESYLRTSLVQETLEKIAALTGGKSFRIGDEDTPLELLESILSEARQFEQTRSMEPAWMDLSPLFLLSGIGFFVTGVLVKR